MRRPMSTIDEDAGRASTRTEVVLVVGIAV
jgi:hypothetical protein